MARNVTLDELLSMWETDSPVDVTNVQNELLKIPQLHSKYLSILITHNILAKKYATKYAELKKIKHLWYTGKLNNPRDLSKYNLEPMMETIHRTDLSLFLESDVELAELLLEKEIHDEISTACTAILKELNSRTWQLRTYLDSRKYLEGN